MATRMTNAHWHVDEVHGPLAALVGTAVATGAAAMLTGWAMSAVFVLPVVALVLLIAGFSIALFFWQASAAEQRLSYRDVAGMLVFLGFAVALLGDASVLPPVLEREG